MNTYDKQLRISSSMESIVLATGWAMAAAGNSVIKRIIEGGAGDDEIDADGIVKAGYPNSVDAANTVINGSPSTGIAALIVFATEHRLSHLAQTIAMHLVAARAGCTVTKGRFGFKYLRPDDWQPPCCRRRNTYIRKTNHMTPGTRTC